MKELIKIVCSECGVEEYTSLEERVGSKCKFSPLTMKPCNGVYEQAESDNISKIAGALLL